MASPTRWTWVWVNSGSWWWTACCDSWGRKESDTIEQLNWTELNQWPASCVLQAASFSRVRLLATPWTVASRAPVSMGFSRQGYQADCCALLQRIFPTQGSKPRLLCLLHWQAGSLPPGAISDLQVGKSHAVSGICTVLTLQRHLTHESLPPSRNTLLSVPMTSHSFPWISS